MTEEEANALAVAAMMAARHGDELAQQKGLLSSIERHVTIALREAEARGYRRGIEEAAAEAQRVWEEDFYDPYSEGQFKQTGEWIADAIRSLIAEKQPG